VWKRRQVWGQQKNKEDIPSEKTPSELVCLGRSIEKRVEKKKNEEGHGMEPKEKGGMWGGEVEEKKAKNKDDASPKKITRCYVAS